MTKPNLNDWVLVGARTHREYMTAESKAELIRHMNAVYEKDNKQGDKGTVVTLPEPVMPMRVVDESEVWE